VRIAHLPAAFLILALAATLAACGSSGEPDETTATATTPRAPAGAAAQSCGKTTVAGTSSTRVTGVGCDTGRGIVAAWAGKAGCAPAAGASRSSCSLRDGYRCLAATTERGVVVSCARPGASVAFLARRG
jgi:hypothetical protein